MNVNISSLNNLGDETFEKMVKSLLIYVIGPGVTPFSKGKDGAREAIYSGEANYPSNFERWKGNWIFQVKFSDINNGIDKARNQIKYLINEELKKLEDYGYIESQKCDNYIYITNVPFSGVSKKGLHDYIEIKKKDFKIKNFDYWDGEKIISFLSSAVNVKESFFPLEGIKYLNHEEVKRVEKIYVKPQQYDRIKDSLVNDKITCIVGQPHIGKTTSSVFLANEIYQKKNLNSMLLIPIIDNVNCLPQITNSVIIFDDLFGETNFESIGKKSKLISHLIKLNNYIIITSRNYIFEEARIEKQLSEYIKHTDTILIQEGSYPSQQLSQILQNHLNLKKDNNILSVTTIDTVQVYKERIINELRFPHNIEVFVDKLSNNTITKKTIGELINSSKKIETVVLSWLKNLNEEEINLLIIISLCGMIDLDDLSSFSENFWTYTSNIINDFIENNDKLLSLIDNELKFRHPSFRNTCYQYLKNQNKESIVQIVIFALTSSETSYKFKYKLKHIFQEIIYDLDVETIITILQSKNINRYILEIIWSSFIKRDMKLAFSTYCDIDKKKKWSLQFISFISSKDYLKKNTIHDFIEYLFSIRNNENKRMVDKIIFYFSFGVREKLDSIIDKIDETLMDQLILKISLLYSKCTIDPVNIIPKLLSYSDHPFSKVRYKVYAALNSLGYRTKLSLFDEFHKMLEFETNKKNINKLNKILSKLGNVDYKIKLQN